MMGNKRRTWISAWVMGQISQQVKSIRNWTTASSGTAVRIYVHSYALPHPNFFKFHVLTSGLAHALSVHLLPLSGTHCLAAFVFVNL